MPAGLPGETLANNLANPNAGPLVLYDLLSGPKGSPFDNDKDVSSGGPRGGLQPCSTGALSNCIGFGSPPLFQPSEIVTGGMGNFFDDYTPGSTKPDGTASADSTIMYIGGGRSSANVGGKAPEVPYTNGVGAGAAGNGGSRDAGAGPAFTGFRTKIVTAVGAVANGAVVETGWVNRSGVALVAGQSVFGTASAASQVPALADGEPLDEPIPAELNANAPAAGLGPVPVEEAVEGTTPPPGWDGEPPPEEV
jgi:hypothetical protein